MKICATTTDNSGERPGETAVAPPQELEPALVAAMKLQFGADEKRISHALSVLGWARELLREEGGDPLVVIAAAVLHDIGIQEAERKHGSSAARYQEIEGPPIARRIMRQLGFQEPTIEHVCRIVANHHSARDIATLEFNIIWDSDWLVNLPDESVGQEPASCPERDQRWQKTSFCPTTIDRVFRTRAGKRRARRLFVEGER